MSQLKNVGRLLTDQLQDRRQIALPRSKRGPSEVKECGTFAVPRRG